MGYSKVTEELLKQRRYAMDKARRLRGRGIEVRGSKYEVDFSTPEVLRSLPLKQRKAALEEFRAFNRRRLERGANGAPISANLLAELRSVASRHDRKHEAQREAMADFVEPSGRRMGMTEREFEESVKARPIFNFRGKRDYKRPSIESFGEIRAEGFMSEDGVNALLGAARRKLRALESPNAVDEHFNRRLDQILDKTPLEGKVRARLAKFTPRQQRQIIRFTSAMDIFERYYGIRKSIGAGGYERFPGEHDLQQSGVESEMNQLFDEAEVFFGLRKPGKNSFNVSPKMRAYRNALSAASAQRQAAARGKSRRSKR